MKPTPFSTYSFSEVVCKIAKGFCFGLSTHYVHQCLTFIYCYCFKWSLRQWIWDNPSFKMAAKSHLLWRGRSFLAASAINRGVYENYWHIFSFKFISRPAYLLTKRRKFQGKPFIFWSLQSHFVKVSKGAKIRNRYNQVTHLTQDTNVKVTNSQLDTTNEIQEVSPFPAGKFVYWRDSMGPILLIEP